LGWFKRDRVLEHKGKKGEKGEKKMRQGVF
jgi:hypothetical protein